MLKGYNQVALKVNFLDKILLAEQCLSHFVRLKATEPSPSLCFGSG